MGVRVGALEGRIVGMRVGAIDGWLEGGCVNKGVGEREVVGTEVGGDVGAGVVAGGVELDVLEYQLEFAE